jgi:hypothetical protein
MYTRALQGYEEALDIETVKTYIPALNTVWNLGSLFQTRKELPNAEQMYRKALAGFQVVLGASCTQSQELERALESVDTARSKPKTLVSRIKRRLLT